jgi:Immunity protein 53
MTEQLHLLESWYSKQCNGDWEHQYGISIQTVDNPRWHAKIDLVDTPLTNKKCDFSERMEGEQNYQRASDGFVFSGFATPKALQKFLQKFHAWANAERISALAYECKI